MPWDLIVIGAGAAGLLAATRAAERGCRTLLLEKNTKPGVKILISGGTRCNITHATDARGIVRAFGDQGSFLHSALAHLSPSDLVKLIEQEGVATKVEEGGKIFPVSDRSVDVRDALVQRLNRSGATLALGTAVEELRRKDQGFVVNTSHGSWETPKVLVTTGGLSYPGCGTTGDGYRWLSELQHTIVPPRPALTPVTTNAPWVRDLMGLTLPDVLVRVQSVDAGQEPRGKRGGAALAERRGALLFTHFGLSGPAVLDVSRVISGHPTPHRLVLTCDLAPDQKVEQLDEQLRHECAADGKRQIVGVLQKLFPRRLAESILGVIHLESVTRAAELPKAQRRRLAEACKQLPIPVSGTLGFKKAEVTAGGVARSEVDSRTMQSKIVPGLYLAGEVLDLDGPIGGYNFQAAFSTGMLAGDSV